MKNAHCQHETPPSRAAAWRAAARGRAVANRTSNWPALIPAVNARHAVRLTISAGPAGRLESRTATPPGRLPATSTQLSLAPLRKLLRHTALDRSGFIPPRTLPFLELPSLELPERVSSHDCP